jgi:serine/threonine-protein kinase RsbW
MYWYGRTNYLGGTLVKHGLAENVQRVQVHSPHEVPAFVEKLEDRMRFFGYSSRDLFALTLAVYEATANAFRHGNRSDPSKWVRINFVVSPYEAMVSVEDQGQGFDPALVPDPRNEENRAQPSGRGLFLMRNYTTWLSIDPPGNRVTLCRRRSDAGMVESPGPGGSNAP